MERTSPIRRLARAEQNVCSWKYGRCLAFCFSLAICIFLFEYYNISSVITAQNLPRILQSIAFATNRSRSIPPINLSIDIQETTFGQTSVKPSTVNKALDYFKRTHFMTVSGNGRLGNQMFEIASLIGTACRHNYTPYIPRNHRINNVFDLKQAKDVHMTNTAVIGEVRAGAYNIKIETLSHDKNWTLSGYFQSWRYFHHCRNEIVNSFRFKPHTRSTVTEVLKTINAKGRPLVGVHVRRSDMASSREMSRGYNVATPEYITKALNYFRKNISNPLFVIVSDDRRWTAAHVNGPDVVFGGTGRPESDLALLSFCNHTIISSGSFGWWGAYLNGGKTVYFSNFPSRGSWLSKQYEPADYYLPEWIGME